MKSNTILRILPAFLITITLAEARSFRVGLLPNGTQLRCANCHVNPGGAGTRTPFGNDVRAAIIASGNAANANVAFWSPALAALDSDGDGITNGHELGDPDGDGIVILDHFATNPGNAPPTFTNTLPAEAEMVIQYLSQLTASDPESNPVTFEVIDAPEWFDIATDGTVDFTPPENTAGTYPITLRVRDIATSTTGFSRQHADLSLDLNVVSSYEGWRRLRFDLPGQEAISGINDSPLGDGIPNIIKYALRQSPFDTVQFSPELTLSENDSLVFHASIRNDDPRLMVLMESSHDLTFSPPIITLPTIEIPGEPNGLDLLRWSSPSSDPAASSMFGRLRFELND